MIQLPVFYRTKHCGAPWPTHRGSVRHGCLKLEGVLPVRPGKARFFAGITRVYEFTLFPPGWKLQLHSSPDGRRYGAGVNLPPTLRGRLNIVLGNDLALTARGSATRSQVASQKVVE